MRDKPEITMGREPPVERSGEAFTRAVCRNEPEQGVLEPRLALQSARIRSRREASNWAGRYVTLALIDVILPKHSFTFTQ